MAKPGAYLDWVTDGSAAKQVEPSDPKKLLGWIGNEAPSFQYFNWLFYLLDQWLKYLETTTDAYRLQYDAYVGTSTGCTYSNIQDAINAASVGWNIFVVDSLTCTTEVSINKTDISITFKDGVTYTKGTGATDCINVSNTGTRATIRGGRFVGFTNAIDLNATVPNVMIRDCRFSGNTVDINDAGNTTYSAEGCITE